MILTEEIAEQSITNALRQNGHNDDEISDILSGIQIPLSEYVLKVSGKDGGPKPSFMETSYEIH